MSGPTVAHLINQLRADAHQPGTAPAVALAAAEKLERFIAWELDWGYAIHDSNLSGGRSGGAAMWDFAEILEGPTSIHSRSPEEER